MHPDRSVEIIEKGRYGSVIYREPAGSLTFHWEFGGSDTVAIIQVNDASEWKAGPSWAVGRRAEILRFVADELIRQRGTDLHAEIDEAAGDILLRKGKALGQDRREAVAWMARYAKLRMKLALIVLIGGALAAAFFWFKNKVLVIDPGKGTPFGLSVRTDGYIATLIQTLEPYTPSLNRDHSQDHYCMSLFLLPLDGSSPGELIPIQTDQPTSSFRLAKILGSDGRTLWVSVNGVAGVDLKTHALITADDLKKANPSLDANWFDDTRGMEVVDRLRLTSRDGEQMLDVDPNTLHAAPVTTPRDPAHSPFAPGPTSFLCAGFFTAPTTWLGVHSPAEVERAFKPKSWVRRIESANDAKEMRHFYRGMLDPESDDASRKILSMTPIGNEDFLNAAFLRVDDRSEPLHLSDPDGALMICTSAPGLKGTLMMARVDTAGQVIWKVDTGIDRFNLSQILPGDRSMAFVGPRPMVPGMVSEPLLVIVNNSSGAVITQSLWR